MGLSTTIKLSENDWDFVKKLSTVVHVNVLTQQVSVLLKPNQFGTGTDKDHKLIFPQNWSLQYVGIQPSKYEDNHMITMTWEIL